MNLDNFQKAIDLYGEFLRSPYAQQAANFYREHPKLQNYAYNIYKNTVPLNMRLLNQGIINKQLDIKNPKTITEKDLTPKEIKKIVTVAQNAPSLTMNNGKIKHLENQVSYNAYNKPQSFVDSSLSDMVIKSFTNPDYSIQTALGQYDFNKGVNEDKVKDVYDFKDWSNDSDFGQLHPFIKSNIKPFNIEITTGNIHNPHQQPFSNYMELKDASKIFNR